MMIRLVVLAIACVVCSSSAQPGELPLLDRDLSVGVLYTEVGPKAEPAIDLAWQQLIFSGMDSYELAVSWSDITDDNGVVDITSLAASLSQFNTFGIQVYLGISTIDTNNLSIPAVFADPNNPRELAPGLSFDSSVVVAAFADVIDQLGPLLAANGVFYFSVGNEVDIWLGSRPDQIAGYTAFAEAARQRIHAWEPDMAVGATLTSEARDKPWIYQPIVAVSDAASFTYYPVFNGQVISPTLAAQEFDAIAAMANGKDILMQEIGCPSGPVGGGGVLGSSYEIQRQWTAAFFQQARLRPQFRFVSFLHIADWPQEIIDIFVLYYGIDDAYFIEYLSTLGSMERDGTPKPAFYELVRQVRMTARGRRLKASNLEGR